MTSSHHTDVSGGEAVVPAGEYHALQDAYEGLLRRFLAERANPSSAKMATEQPRDTVALAKAAVAEAAVAKAAVAEMAGEEALVAEVQTISEAEGRTHEVMHSSTNPTT